MLCQPSIELDVNIALMYQLEGYELETVDLNDIVDVINYNDVDTDYLQLRVVEFSYSVWNKTDASVKLSNITLDSTDIFRKAVTATNIINTGTLEASKVINIYKGGQSVEQTMIVLDGKAEFSYSELTRTDTGIIARVTHTEDEYNTLSGTVGRHTEEIGSWDITSGSITSSILATTSELNTVSGNLEITSSKVNILERNVSELNSKIQDIADITTYGETDRGKVELNDINESEPIMIKIHPTTANISYLYPRNDLYPSDTLYMTDRRIRFKRTYDEDNVTKVEYIYYELPNDLLRYSDSIYDEFLLDYDNRICQVIKRCGYNADGSVYQLVQEQTIDYPYPSIFLGDGNYEISLLGYDNAYVYIRLMAKNIYTSQFATRAEVHTEIDQTATSITTMVSATYERRDHAEINYSQLQQTANNISITVANNNTKANIIAKINDNTSEAKINADVVNISANDVLNILSNNQINLSTKNITINSNNFSVDSNGNITANGGNIAGWGIDSSHIYKTREDGYVMEMRSDRGLSDPVLLVWNETDGYKWYVTPNGYMYAKNAHIEGYIESSSGRIAAYTINNNTLVGNKVGMSGQSGDNFAFWAGSNNSSNAPFRVGHDGELYASNANVTGTVNANSGTFKNVTIKNNCIIEGTFDASKITSGTFSTARIPNLSANKITSGTMSGNRISGGTINASAMSAMTISADIVSVNTTSGHFEIGDDAGKSFNLIVQHEGSSWRRLVFKGGILVAVQSSW